MPNRIVPELPPQDQQLRVIIDTDAANEIDDLYAIALAVYSPDRFSIEGMVATHFAQKAGRGSIEESYRVVIALLESGGRGEDFPVVTGGDPIPYVDEPVDSDGARMIIERANAGSPEKPLWVVGLGAASNLASAVLIDPGIKDKVRYVFHARSEWSWPSHSEQFNVGGDVRAARCLLQSGVPLVWFDTGQQLVASMEKTETLLKPLGGIPEFLHDYRHRERWYQESQKGFFDLADIAWMLEPTVCVSEVVDAPRMDYLMRFHHDHDLGKILRVSDIQAEPAWKLFFERMAG